MAKYTKDNTLLFDRSGNPICDHSGNYNPFTTAAGLYFNPYGPGNTGKYRPWINNYTQDTEQSINSSDRNQLVALSRQVFAQMAEIEAASKQKADLIVGLGMDPLWHGDESAWSTEMLRWVKKSFYPNCTPYGIAYDWKTVWKTVSMMIDRDGDILMALRTDRYGNPKLSFIHSHRIGQRFNQTEIKNGKFSGYEVRDGVVYASNGDTPIGYNILGKTEEDDKVLSVDSAFLIFNPFCFDKGRGKPILSAALKDCFNLQDIDEFMSQGIKILASIYFTEKNAEGKANPARVGNPYLGGVIIPTDDATKAPVSEYFKGGIRYTKIEGEIANIKNDSIGETALEYISRLEKRIMALMEFPHQWMLSPETMGGTMSRGIKETISRAVQSRQSMIEKYAKIGIEFAVNRAMSIGQLTENLGNEWEQFDELIDFTKAAELILDPGYEHGADLAKVLNGLMSCEDFVRKWTRKSYKETLQQKTKDVRTFLDSLDQIKKDFPQYADIALNLLGSKEAPQPAPQAPADNKEQK